MTRHSTRELVVLLGIGFALAAGCKAPGTGLNAPVVAINDQSSSDLSPAQVADMQVALGRTLEQRGDFDQARQAYTSAMGKDPSRPDAYIRLGTMLARRGEFGPATEMYQRALQIDPNNADVYCNLGYANYLQEHWAEAEAALRKCLALQPDHKRAHNNLGLVLARRHEPDQALAEFRKAGGSDSDSRLNLAYSQTVRGDLGDARQQYDKVLAREPNCEAAKNGLKRIDMLAQKLQSEVGPVVVAYQGPPSPPKKSVAPVTAAQDEERRLAELAIAEMDRAINQASPPPKP